ncbi:MAG: hypothetical protein NC543_03920 [bacterium]|nr:hypothetical protein [bacterium]MCM1373793.1 hypothetical protein [Muribaculum sp.]
MKNWLKIRIGVCICLYAFWWGLLCPELLVNPDTCRVVDGDTGEEMPAQLKQTSAEQLYQALQEADRTHIRYRSRLLELLEQLLEKG